MFANLLRPTAAEEEEPAPNSFMQAAAAAGAAEAQVYGEEIPGASAEPASPGANAASRRASAASAVDDEGEGSDVPEDAPEPDATNMTLGGDINTLSMEELRLDKNVVKEAQESWNIFCTGAGSREAAGEAIYTALFEGAPSLQALFTTPRAVQGMRFVGGLDSFVNALDTPKQLKALVETLAFGHLNLDVTVSRVVLFRDAILDLFDTELAHLFTNGAKAGWQALLNYVGGAIIYIKSTYAERLKLLETSWHKACNAAKDDAKAAAEKLKHDDEGSNHADEHSDGGKLFEEGFADEEGDGLGDQRPKKRCFRKCLGKVCCCCTKIKNIRVPKSMSMRNVKSHSREHEGEGSDHSGHDNEQSTNAPQVIRTFEAMFDFNAAVMGFNASAWLREVVDCFDDMVKNIANAKRLQEECDVLVLKITKVQKGGDINLAEFKSCMLATLRSLLPKDWDSVHEVAWNWLWDNIERMVKKSLGRPKAWQTALINFLGSLDEQTRYDMRAEIYQRFFKASPQGQEFFKQSDTRLHYIADQIMNIVLDLFEKPHDMVDFISALGLRHVGYGIPTEHFGPFVSVCCEVAATLTEDELVLEAYRWGLGLVSKMLTRTITEGSTIVMKASNENNIFMLRKALASAPRGSRAQWVLKIQVGTQSISPLMWSIESGRVESAKAIIQDLLVIRADREKYYYGLEEIFERHPDFVLRLILEAPVLIPTFLEGLVWRSRVATKGTRRVNYYVKHLIAKDDWSISEALMWMVEAKEPKTMAHPVMILVSDTIWAGLVCRQFIYSKIWFLCSLFVFMMCEAILPKSEAANETGVRVLIFLGRLGIYTFTMGRLLKFHVGKWAKAWKEKDFVRCCCCLKIPHYLKEITLLGNFLLLIFLLLMCTHEPIWWCGNSNPEHPFPSVDCPEASYITWRYSVFVMGAITIHWLLLIDLAVFSTGLSAFVLVVGQVLSEMTRFLTALIFLLLTFGSAISVLEHGYFEMRDIPNTAICLFAITIRLFEDDYRDLLMEPALLAAVFLFVTASAVVLLNLLIAQINCSYVFIYQDMLGFARLRRAGVIVETLSKIRKSTWDSYVMSLGLQDPIEFNEGDVGLAGGLQILEPASLHPTTSDTILRFGGSCSGEMPWPEEAELAAEEDKFMKLERGLNKILKQLNKTFKRGHRMTGVGSGSGDDNTGREQRSDDDSGREHDDIEPDYGSVIG